MNRTDDFGSEGEGLNEQERMARESQMNEPARPDGSGVFRDHERDDDLPLSAWLREFFSRPQVQEFMENTKHKAEQAGIDVNKVQDVAQNAKHSAQGWLEKLEQQAREKPLQTLAMVFGAGLLLSRVGRGRR